MDQQLRLINRKLLAGEISAEEAKSANRRFCPYSEQSVRIALKILNDDLDRDYVGGIIASYLNHRGWETIESPRSTEPGVEYFVISIVNSAGTSIYQITRASRIAPSVITYTCCLGSLSSQRRCKSGLTADVEHLIRKWALRRAQFAWYYNLKEPERWEALMPKKNTPHHQIPKNKL